MSCGYATPLVCCSVLVGRSGRRLVSSQAKQDAFELARLDVGRLMGSLVGQTEERTRALLAAIDA